MFNNEEQFAQLIGGLDVNAEPDPQHRKRIREQMLSEFKDVSFASKPSISTWPSRRGIGFMGNTVVSYWSTLMSSRLSRYAAVAVVAVAIIMGLTFFGGKTKQGGTAWAIEQTIEALQNVRSLYIKATQNSDFLINQGDKEDQKEIADKVQSFIIEAWATSDNGIDQDQSRLDMYIVPRETGDDGPSTIKLKRGLFTMGVNEPALIKVKRNNTVFSYTPASNAVDVEGPKALQVFESWPGPSFQNLQKEAQKPNSQWQEEYGKDEITGRESVFVRYVGKNNTEAPDVSFLYQFDVQSKLPVRIKIWNNTNWEGTPDAVVEPVYNIAIPEDQFDFPISAKSLQVNDRRESTPESEKTFTIEAPDETCIFPEVVENALKAKAEQ